MEKVDKVTYCLTGSPKPYWSTKADFQADMEKWGYKYTTLTKTTDILIAADEDLGTLKCQKAEKYGIKIYNYTDAFNKKEMLYTKTMRKKRLIQLSKISKANNG